MSFMNKIIIWQVGLLGEKLQIYREENLDNIEWNNIEGYFNQSLTWYMVCCRNFWTNIENLSTFLQFICITLINKTLIKKFQTFFDAPVGNDPVALNLSSMAKGEAWINGQSIGRYWVSFLTSKGKPSQTM